MAAKARSRTPAEAVDATAGKLAVAAMSTMPAMRVCPVQRGSECARTTPAPKATPPKIMSTE